MIVLTRRCLSHTLVVSLTYSLVVDVPPLTRDGSLSLILKLSL